MTRRATSTSAFGVSRRESHDASRFYGRFTSPQISDDAAVSPVKALDKLIVGDARHMNEVEDGSVALVVTSPPYFAGKEYEETLGDGHVPGTYIEYLHLLRDVFAECVRKLEPGGRIAVNVANLGRRPYRSLSADVTGILQDDLRLLLRGEVIWVKQRGASGSCAWGSFQRPANPVMRDLTERVIIAAKGRFDRALNTRERQAVDLPFDPSMTRDDFMEYTLDLWEFPAESARRVGHPAPFPVELPSRLIELFTYRGDLVLDPFVGSGSTAVASVRSGRHYVGYDLDDAYVRLAETRVSEEQARLSPPQARLAMDVVDVRIPPLVDLGRHEPTSEDPLSVAIKEGRSAAEIAGILLSSAGFVDLRRRKKLSGGVQVSFVGGDESGRSWIFDLCGAFTTHRPGLSRPDALWRAIGRAAVVHGGGAGPTVLLTCGPPPRSGAGADALRQVTGPGKPIRAVVDILDPGAHEALGRLRRCDAP
jgi:DNA modification methylase